MTERRYVIGTRGSPLARAQAEETMRRLVAAHDLDPAALTIEVIAVKGDQVLDRSLQEIGGKGLFTKEIDAALLDGRIDLAVHSMKDVQTTLDPRLSIRALLPREDARDAFLSATAARLAELPPGALVGTASLRRQAQVLNRRPDLRVAIFRGNVQTRMAKLADGQADATFLALAGLNRLGMASAARSVVDLAEMTPACAQGAIGVAARADDAAVAALLAPLECRETRLRVEAERAFLALLDGDCRTPIAGHAWREADGALAFTGELLTPDGRDRRASARRAPVETVEGAMRLGRDAAEDVLAAADPAFLRAAAGR